MPCCALRSIFSLTVVTLAFAAQSIGQQVVAKIPAPASYLIKDIAVDSGNSRVYVSLYYTDTTGPNGAALLIIDGKSNTVVKSSGVGASGELPLGLAVDAATHKLYVTNCFLVIPMVPCYVNIFDPDGNSLGSTLVTQTSNAGLASIAVNPVTNVVYVSDQDETDSEGNNITVIDGATDDVVAYISFGQDNPGVLAVDPLNNELFVVATSGTLEVINGRTNAVVRSSASGEFGQSLVLDPFTGKAYVGLSSGVFGVVDMATLTTIATKNIPPVVAVDTASDRVFSTAASHAIAVVDGKTGRRIDTIRNATGPLGVNMATGVIYALAEPVNVSEVICCGAAETIAAIKEPR